LNRSSNSVQPGQPPQPGRFTDRNSVVPLISLSVLLAFDIWLIASAAQRLIAQAKDGNENLDLLPLLLVVSLGFLVLGVFAQQLKRRSASLGFFMIGGGLFAWFFILFYLQVS